MMPYFPQFAHFHPPSLPCLFYLVAGLPEGPLVPLLHPPSPQYLPDPFLEQSFASSLKLAPRSSQALSCHLPQNPTSCSWPQAQAHPPVEPPHLRQPGPPIFFTLPPRSCLLRFSSVLRFCLPSCDLNFHSGLPTRLFLPHHLQRLSPGRSGLPAPSPHRSSSSLTRVPAGWSHIQLLTIAISSAVLNRMAFKKKFQFSFNPSSMSERGLNEIVK